MKKKYTRQLGCLGLLVVAGSVNGQLHETEIQEVEVSAHPLSGEGLAQPVTVLSGSKLEQNLAGNIGDTLARLPGIHSATFGQAVGRPVIHGLSGPRVRIMEDRIDTLDVSVTSGDHAVAVEPFIAEQIEVFKGAGALLYGSGAIGGVVDVHTGRIPHEVPEALTGGIETRFNNNNDGSTTAFKLNGGSGVFAWHLDGTLKEAEDYEIPGFAESAALRAQEEAEGEAGDEEEVRGSLPGSEFDSRSLAAGFSYIQDWGFVGLAVSDIEANYGLPGGHAEEEGEGEEAAEEEGVPVLDLEQTRTDFELGVNDPFGVFDLLNIRVGYNDYEHAEIEPNGEQATLFSNEAWEARGELVYDTELWRHVFGAQYMDREFSAVGEESFVPPVDSTESGLFWLGERDFDGFDLEVGLRAGRVSHSPQVASSESFSTYAASAGVVVPFSNDWQLGLNLDYSSRAPVAEELFSNGPHLATQTFELGNSQLDNEKAVNLSATLQYADDDWRANITGYYTAFSDFIFQQATGEEEDGLPVVAYLQDDATFFGTDLEFAFRLVEWSGGNIWLRAQADYVDAELDQSRNGNDNLPRIPPTRFGFGLDMNWQRLNASVDYLRVQEQDDIAELELVTDAYSDLAVYLNYEVMASGTTTVELFLHGKNLTDDEQRNHTSFIKDFAPAPGRTVEAGVRLNF